MPIVAHAASPNAVISQVYGGGGNSGATYTHDFIEVFNHGSSAVDLTSMSVQYGSTTGNIGPNSSQITPLSGSLAPGQYLLVQEAQGAGGTTPLPTPDVTDATPIAMSATGGKVALVNGTAAINCGSSTTPCSAAALALIVDLVGYDGANLYEGTPTPSLSNTTAALRINGGCTDTDNNGADFVVGGPTPRNTSSPLNFCPTDQPPQITSRSPSSGAADVPVDAGIDIGFSEPVAVSGSWFAISCTTSGNHTAAVNGGPVSFSLDPDANFASGETCTVTIFAANVSDQDSDDPPDHPTADDAWSFTTIAQPAAIHDLQGSAHVSPFNGQNVSNVNGIVTAKRSNGFYMQDPSPDGSDSTSEGIFVFTSSSPSSVSVGDAVRVSGHVQEFRPGGSASTNLSTTEIGSPATTVLSHGNPLPAPTVLGTGGRIPPDQVIEDDATGDVETSGLFDPDQDGLDFYESVEGMRVQLNDAVAVGPTNSFGETPVVGDGGAHAGIRTVRGGLLLRPADANPERLVADDAIIAMPNLNVGDGYSAALVGVMDYSFGNFFLEVTEPVSRVDNHLPREVTAPVGPDELAVATFNFENLAATDPQSKFDSLASLIVTNLRSPDLLAGEEVQDNTGATNDGTVDSAQTLTRLVDAIQDAGGPVYGWREIDPVNNQDGGQPGGNIRQVFLFRTDRGLSFIDRPGGTPTAATGVVGSGDSTQLTFSPGRIDPANSAWNSSRKPLAAEFSYRGHHLFAIVNHFNSKGGDQPLEGRFQPPDRPSEVQRHQQAQLVADFVSQITAADADASIVVLGDLNDFEFSETVSILKAAGMHDLIESLPQNERYSYEFEGNAQVLDHILLSGALFARPFVFDAVHVNAEFFDQASDHDPSVVRIELNDAPTVSAGGPYTVAEGGSVALTASGSDPEGGPLSYAWDLDGNGTFETTSQTATFSAVNIDGPATRTMQVRVTDDAGQSATDTATVMVVNIAPTATFGATASVFAGFPFTLSLTNPSDPSPADTAAGFTFAFDCGDGAGYGTFGSSASTSCATSDVGVRSVGGMIRDKDGGVTEYRTAVDVRVTFDSLCALTRVYSSKPQVADALCMKLRNASLATDAETRNSLLTAYQNQVAAQVDKAFTATQAATLKRLANRLRA